MENWSPSNSSVAEGIDPIDEDLSPLDIDADDQLANVPIGSCLNVFDPDDIMDELRCIVCKTVPFTAIYRCSNGHNTCCGCYQIRVLDKMLGTMLGTCSLCHVRIYRNACDRNLDGERALAALLVTCASCEQQLERSQLRQHGLWECPQRLMGCKYKRIGCDWKGIVGEAVSEHEESCTYREKTGLDLLEQLRKRDEQQRAKQCLVGKVMKLMQLPRITVRMLQVKPQEDGFPRNQFLPCGSYTAFKESWTLQLMWQAPDDAHLPYDVMSGNCSLVFRLRLSLDTIRHPISITYTLVSGINSEVRFEPNLCEKFDFSWEHQDGPPTLLYQNSWKNLNKLIREHGFFIRLLMARI